MQEHVSFRKTFDKTIQCPTCKELITIKMTCSIDVEDFDLYKVVT